MVDILRELDSNPLEWTDSYGKEAYSPTLEPVDSDSNWKVPKDTYSDHCNILIQAKHTVKLKEDIYSLRLKFE